MLDEMTTHRDFTLARRLGRQLARDEATWVEAEDMIEDAFDDDLLRAAARMAFGAAASWRVYG
jgi:hypothetical protein